MGLTRLVTAAVPAVHKAVDSRRLSVTAALTYPVTDRAGDYVVPHGIDWTVHKADPWVGLEHYRVRGNEWVIPSTQADNALRPVRVGTARDPDTGGYGVQLKAMPEGNIPFGTTVFDARDRLSNQTFGLVEDGTLEGVSIEFVLIKGFYRELGPSPLEARPAYHVDRCSGLGWVHCQTPVNPSALTLRKGLTPAQEKAIRVAESGRVGSEPAHPLILKAFRDRYGPALGKSATVTGNYDPQRKAMPDDAAMEAAYAPEEDAAAEPTGGGSTPTVQALYQLAQSLQDMKSQVEEMLAGSEHVKGKKFATKLLADLDETAADATDMAAKIEAELGAKEDAAEDAEPEPDVEDGDNDPDDEGVLKCIRRRPAVFKAIRRFTVAEVRKAQPAAVVPEPAPEPAADDLVAQLEALQRDDPDAYARLARRAERKLRLA